MTAKTTPFPPPNEGTNQSPSPRKHVSGAGEMADLTRAHDWASTPLGPIDTWSDTLLCSVNVMLSCRFPTVIFWGPEMIQFYNDGYRPLMAEKHPTALGQSARECWREAWHLIGPQWEAVLANGETTYRKEVLVPVLRNGRLQNIYWTYSYSPIYGPDGAVDGILIVCHDVTDEVIAAQNLRESEARATRVLESIGDAVVVTDANTCILRMNPVAESLTGWTSAEAKGRQLSEVFHIVNEATRQVVESPVDKVKRLGTTVGLANHTILIRKDGTETPIDDSGAPIRDDEGNLTGIVLVFRDIAELKRTETALIQSEKLAAVGRLASSIAHEINNPLESVMNLIYLARQYAVAPEAQQFLDTADQEIRRVSIIANQTLRFHKQPSNPQEISCFDLFSTVIGIYEGKLRNAGIEIERRYRAEHPVICFEGDIRQVLNNLVGNAIDAMPTGGRLLLRSRAATDWRTGRNGLTLTIADTGVGMDAQVRQKIFEPFFTTKGIGGTGLGLWVSQEIVQRHNGALRVRSSQREGNSGTVFALFLPFDATIR
jgi:PAS domain S-box-containing protein